MDRAELLEARKWWRTGLFAALLLPFLLGCDRSGSTRLKTEGYPVAEKLPPMNEDRGLRPDQGEIINSIGMRLAHIKPGKFWMGSPVWEKDRSADEEQHEVEICKPFYLGVFEVTQEEYQKVMGQGTNPSWFCSTGMYADSVKEKDTRRFPVEGVSWDDAKEFCRRLTDLPAEKKLGRLYRLPTEAEWEHACRGGTSSKDTLPYHFGLSLSEEQANFGSNLRANTTRPVGSYRPNAFGLHDMHGNVWEWCEDWYGPYDCDSPRDPQGARSGIERVQRGGSWSNHVWVCRAAYRGRGLPGDRIIRNAGIRVVCILQDR
jgi:formylglycine-generating enzyme required for sulfatase activity